MSNVQPAIRCNAFDGFSFLWFDLIYQHQCIGWWANDNLFQLTIWQPIHLMHCPKVSQKYIELLLRMDEILWSVLKLHFQQLLNSPMMCQHKYFDLKRKLRLSTRVQRIIKYWLTFGKFIVHKVLVWFIPDIGQRLNFYRLICCPNFQSMAPISSNRADSGSFSIECSIDIKRIRVMDTNKWNFER